MTQSKFELEMTESQKHQLTLVILFLFMAVGAGIFASLVDFHLALQRFSKDGSYLKGAVICLLDGVFCFAYMLFLLAFSGLLKTKETPATLLDVLGYAIFLRFMLIGFIVFHALPLEGQSNFFQLKMEYISPMGQVLSLSQLICMTIAFIVLGKENHPESHPGYGKAVPIDQYAPVSDIFSGGSTTSSTPTTNTPPKAETTPPPSQDKEAPTPSEESEKSVESKESEESEKSEEAKASEEQEEAKDSKSTANAKGSKKTKAGKKGK